MSGRLYTFRYFRDDHMVSVNHIQAEDDKEATALAKEAMFGFEVEVWDDGRLVHSFREQAHQARPI